MQSGDHLLRFSATRFVPGGGRQDARFAGFHSGQARQDVGEVSFEILPLVEGIGDGFAEFGARQDAADTEFDDGLVKATMDHPAFRCANCFAQGGACFGFTKPFFDLIEKGDLMEYPGDELRGLVIGVIDLQTMTTINPPTQMPTNGAWDPAYLPDTVTSTLPAIS
jgi:hypothetical protein